MPDHQKAFDALLAGMLRGYWTKEDVPTRATPRVRSE